MTEPSEDQLERAIRQVRATHIPECPGSLLPPVVRHQREQPSRRSSRVFSVVLALSVLAAVLVLSGLHDSRRVAPRESIASSSDQTSETAADRINELSGTTPDGLIRRSAVETVSHAATDPREPFRVGFLEMELVLRDVSRRVQLLEVRQDVHELNLALSRLIASAR